MDYPPLLPDPGTNSIRRYVIATPSPEDRSDQFADPRSRGVRYAELLSLAAALRRRHRRSDGNFVRLSSPENTAFLRNLRRDAQRISDEELTFLLQPGRMGNWRPRLVAAHLIGIDRRTQFRDVIGDLLLAGGVDLSGQGCCFALAAFGTDSDTKILTAYLDRFLPRNLYPPRNDLQDWAMGALVHLDAQLNTSHAEQYLGDGLWDRFSANAAYKPCREYIENLSAL